MHVAHLATTLLKDEAYRVDPAQSCVHITDIHHKEQTPEFIENSQKK